jgi:antitoxin CptB
MTQTELRKRRAAWRASHRGTKELDILVGQYAGAKLEAMTEVELDHFEAFLDVSDNDLQSWLIAPRSLADDKFTDLVAAVRVFHGLSA